MSTKIYWIIGIAIVIIFIGYKKGWFSSSANASVDVATSCYKQLAAFIDNNPTMTGADIKNNFVSNVNCSKL